jgi:hypothetical protein
MKNKQIKYSKRRRRRRRRRATRTKDRLEIWRI